MRNIIIIDCRSTGINFISDIKKRNCNPIVLENNIYAGAYSKEVCNFHYSFCDEEFEIIYEKNTYEETLEMVKKYDPILILPGADMGIELATKLSNDLGLISNSSKNLKAMMFKDEMQNALAKAGLRHIKGKVVSSIDEGIEYYNSNEFDGAVIKPLRGASSNNVFLCNHIDEFIHNLSIIFNNVNWSGEKIEEVLIQEYIRGDEYFVNTISSRGKHKFTDMWKYEKHINKEGFNIYDSMQPVDRFSISQMEIIQYAYDVADAIGIEYGPIHAEYIVDDKGPVLIEVNCRPCGGKMPADFLNRIFHHHYTDVILQAYLEPEKFDLFMKKNFFVSEYAKVKFLSIPKDIVAESSPITHISNKLESHYFTRVPKVAGGNNIFYKTDDLDSVFAVIFLINKNQYVLNNDFKFLTDLEKNAFSQVLSDGSNKRKSLNPNDSFEDIEEIMDIAKSYFSTLFVTDQFIDDESIVQSRIDDVSDVSDFFDSIVFNLNESLIKKTDEEIAIAILNVLTKLKHGGMVFVHESTYQYISDGRNGIEALLLTLGFKLEVPSHYMRDTVVAVYK